MGKGKIQIIDFPVMTMWMRTIVNTGYCQIDIGEGVSCRRETHMEYSFQFKGKDDVVDWFWMCVKCMDKFVRGKTPAGGFSINKFDRYLYPICDDSGNCYIRLVEDEG